MTKVEDEVRGLIKDLRELFFPEKVVRPDYRVYPEGESLTKQAFRDECDINVIMARYENSGVLPVLASKEPRFGDFSSVEDYHSACNRVLEAQALFDGMPASVRDHFGNDPERLIAACSDETRVDELRELGLLEVVAADSVAPEAVPPGGDSGGGTPNT